MVRHLITVLLGTTGAQEDGHMYRQQGAVAEALDCFQQALPIVEQLGAKKDVERLRLAIAELSDDLSRT